MHHKLKYNNANPDPAMEPQALQTNKNFIVNVINLIVNFAIGIFYTPYLVQSLGITAYGILPLALIINQYISILTASLTGSFGRFYSVSLQQNNYLDASKYLSSALVAITSIIIVFLPVCAIGIMKIESIFNIPGQFVTNARILFAFTILGLFLSLYSSLFNVTLYAKNRLDLLNFISINRIIIKIIIIIIMFESIGKNVSFIGYSVFLAELLVLSLSLYYFKIISAKRIIISPLNFEKGALYSIVVMTSWVIVNQIGAAGLYSTDNILVNKFWSTRESGILGALTELGSYVSNVVSVISSLFGPLILIAYAHRDHSKVKELSLNSSLFVGVATALLIGVLIGFARPIISFWLGNYYINYSPWLILKLVTLPFFIASGIFAFVFRAWNQVMLPAILTLLIGIINILISYQICKASNGDQLFIKYMLLFSVICILFQSFVLNSYLFHRIYPEVTKYNLFIIFAKIAFALAISSAIALLFNYVISLTALISLIISLAIVTIVCMITGFYLLFSRNQRNTLIQIIVNLRIPSRNY